MVSLFTDSESELIASSLMRMQAIHRYAEDHMDMLIEWLEECRLQAVVQGCLNQIDKVGCVGLEAWGDEDFEKDLDETFEEIFL